MNVAALIVPHVKEEILSSSICLLVIIQKFLFLPTLVKQLQTLVAKQGTQETFRLSTLHVYLHMK